MSVLTAEQLIAIRGSGLIDPSYANILDLLDTIDALREQIATAERLAYQKTLNFIYDAHNSDTLGFSHVEDWLEQRIGEAAGPEGRNVESK